MATIANDGECIMTTAAACTSLADGSKEWRRGLLCSNRNFAHVELSCRQRAIANREQLSKAALDAQAVTVTWGACCMRLHAPQRRRGGQRRGEAARALVNNNNTHAAGPPFGTRAQYRKAVSTMKSECGLDFDILYRLRFLLSSTSPLQNS